MSNIEMSKVTREDSALHFVPKPASGLLDEGSGLKKEVLADTWYKIELTHKDVVLRMDFVHDKIRANELLDAMKKFNETLTEENGKRGENYFFIASRVRTSAIYCKSERDET